MIPSPFDMGLMLVACSVIMAMTPFIPDSVFFPKLMETKFNTGRETRTVTLFKQTINEARRDGNRYFYHAEFTPINSPWTKIIQYPLKDTAGLGAERGRMRALPGLFPGFADTVYSLTDFKPANR